MSGQTPYCLRVFGRADEIDRSAWHEVWAASGSPTFLDIRFVEAIDKALAPQCRFRYVVLYDEDRRPVACAGLTLAAIDLAGVGDPLLKRIFDRAPRALSRLRMLDVLYCSLPGSPGDRSIAIAPWASTAQVLAALDRMMVRLARDERVDAIVWKEFGPAELVQVNGLSSLGYRRIEVPPMHLLEPCFRGFAEYCAALRKKFRQTITRSTRKLTESGITVRTFTSPDEILERYTPPVHELYCDVVRRSDVQVELLPIGYYHELVRQLPEQVELVALLQGERILAFGWCLRDVASYHIMYGGFDHELNREHDLYFNMAYACIDRAFQAGVERIHVGQTSTDFKARLGCHSEPRYIYAKGNGLLMSALFRWGSNLLVMKQPARDPAHVFKGREQVAPGSSRRT